MNNIRRKFQFWTKIEIKMTYLVFVFSNLLSLRLQSHLEAILSTFKILSCTNSKKNGKTTFSYTNSHSVLAACGLIAVFQYPFISVDFVSFYFASVRLVPIDCRKDIKFCVWKFKARGGSDYTYRFLGLGIMGLTNDKRLGRILGKKIKHCCLPASLSCTQTFSYFSFSIVVLLTSPLALAINKSPRFLFYISRALNGRSTIEGL